MAADLTWERLRHLLRYDRVTGVFSWRVSRGRQAAGATAGNRRYDGYLQIEVDGRRYYASRLAWFYVKKQWPSGLIDHKDLDTSNNAFRNLRDVTETLNMQNRRRPQANNKTGFLGVSLYKPNGKFRAVISAGGKYISLGYFLDPLEASKAYIKAKRQLHEGYTL